MGDDLNGFSVCHCIDRPQEVLFTLIQDLVDLVIMSLKDGSGCELVVEEGDLL